MKKNFRIKFSFFYIPQIFDNRFSDTEQLSSYSLQLYTFKLPKTKSLEKLRRNILTKLADLYESYPNEVEDIFEKYTNSLYDDKLKDIYSNEQDLICLFFEKWNLNQYKFLKFVYKYIESGKT